jgi:hypothetical protein
VSEWRAKGGLFVCEGVHRCGRWADYLTDRVVQIGAVGTHTASTDQYRHANNRHMESSFRILLRKSVRFIRSRSCDVCLDILAVGAK